MHKPTQRVIDILNFLETKPKGATQTEISNETSIPKSTLFPILKTLEENRFLICEDGYYKIGIMMWCIGQNFSKSSVILELIKEKMQEIVKEVNEICQLSILTGQYTTYIEKVNPKQPVQLISSVGKMIPAYATSLGKSLLSNLNYDELKKIYPNGLTALTENTITDIDVLYNQIQDIRKYGYSYEIEESMRDIICFAVPLSHGDEVEYAISVSIPKYRATKSKKEKIIKCLLNKKEEINEIINKFE